MQLEIRSRHPGLPRETRRAVERHLRLTLGRRAVRVERAQISLLPDPRPDQPGARLCRIRARLRDGEQIVVEDSAPEAGEAAAKAAWRLEHVLQRQSVRELVMHQRA